MTLDQAKQRNTAHCSKHKRELEVIYYCPDCDDEESNQVQAGVSPRMGKVELMNILNDIGEKVNDGDIEDMPI